jgi:guanylate kinase
MSGKLVIVTSPSGGGKGTLLRRVRTMLPDLGFAISHTTRAPRAGEEHGREYFFISRGEFENMIRAGEFLEHAVVHGNLYGTSLIESEKLARGGQDLLVEIDVQGAIQILDKRPDLCYSIFILPPSFDVLRYRLTARGTEQPADLQMRLQNAFTEVAHYEQFDYIVINNDLDFASDQIAAIISAERQRPNRQTDAVRVILNSFDDAKHLFNGEE